LFVDFAQAAVVEYCPDEPEPVASVASTFFVSLSNLVPLLSCFFN
jgi:hypothetical protein